MKPGNRRSTLDASTLRHEPAGSGEPDEIVERGSEHPRQGQTCRQGARVRWFAWRPEQAWGVLAWLLLGAACAWTIAYILYRAIQLYPLDAFEEYELLKAVWWTRGVGLYGSPASEVFPTAYPPLHYWLLAAWTRVLGVSFLAPRILSLTAIAGAAAAGLWELRRAADPARARLIFISLLLAFHPLTGKWFELCKGDPLLLLFLSVAVAAGRHRSGTEIFLGSAAMLMASLTKQNAPIFLFPLCAAHAACGRWRWAAGWGFAMGMVMAAAYWLVHRDSGGHFFYWIFHWTAGHGVDVAHGAARMLGAVATRAPLLLPIVAGSVWLRPRCQWTWCLLAALVSGLLGMSKHGGLENHLLPAALFAAVQAGRLLSEWLCRTHRGGGYPEGIEQGGSAPAPSTISVPSHCLGAARWSRFAVATLLAIGLWCGLPRRADFRWVERRAGEADAWVRAVRDLRGSIAVSHHALLADRAGAACFFSDLILQFPGLQIPQSVRQRISDEEFDYLILENRADRCRTPGWGELIDAHYSPFGQLDYPNRSGLLPRLLYRARRLSCVAP